MPGHLPDKIDRIEEIHKACHIDKPELLRVSLTHSDVPRSDHRATNVGTSGDETSDQMTATRHSRKVDPGPGKGVLEHSDSGIDQGDLTWATAMLVAAR